MIDGLELWDIEAEFYIRKRGLDPDEARTLVIVRWMLHGNFDPLIAAIAAEQELDEVVLGLLAMMLEGDIKMPFHLKAVPRRRRRRGRHKHPGNEIRDLVASLLYEANEGKSDEVFKRIGEAIGRSDRTVRQAVTALRKQKHAK